MHRRMTVAALMAAAALICFVYLRIEVPMAFGLTGKVYFGYTFILIGALLTGRWYGALAGAVGLTMADLLAGYVTSALPTFLSFAVLGYLAGAGADWWRARYGETKWMALTVSAVAFTIFALVEPLIRSTFKYFVLGYRWRSVPPATYSLPASCARRRHLFCWPFCIPPCAALCRS